MFKNIVTDYKELVWNPQNEFLKKHWKEYLVLLGASFTVGAVVPTIINKIKKRKYQKQLNKMYESKED